MRRMSQKYWQKMKDRRDAELAGGVGNGRQGSGTDNTQLNQANAMFDLQRRVEGGCRHTWATIVLQCVVPTILNMKQSWA